MIEGGVTGTFLFTLKSCAWDFWIMSRRSDQRAKRFFFPSFGAQADSGRRMSSVVATGGQFAKDLPSLHENCGVGAIRLAAESALKILQVPDDKLNDLIGAKGKA
jgi:hypothetical protein